MVIYIKEILILIIQLIIFYIIPLLIRQIDTMGVVFLIWLSTMFLGCIITLISSKKIKYLYPIIIAMLFIPSIPIYYNSSALVHSLWYLISSSIGILIGCIINYIKKQIKKKE